MSTRAWAASPLRGPYLATTLGVVSVITLVAFESMAISTAMPVVAQALDAVRAYGFVFGSFLTASIVGNVLAGAWSDARGPRGPMLVGLGLFAGGMVLCAAAPDIAVLVTGRAVAGLGAGMLMTATYVVIGRLIPGALQPRLFGLMSAAWVLPGLLGPPIAGFLAQHVTWRAVFGLVPVFVVPPALALVPKLARLTSTERLPIPWGRVGSGVALAAGAGAVQWGLGSLTTGGPAAPIVAVAGAVVLAAALPGLLPRGALRLARGLPTVIVVRGLYAGAFFGVDAFVPLMLVSLRGLTPTVAGLVLAAASIGWTIGSWLQGRPGLTVPRHRLLAGGAVFVALGEISLVAVTGPALPPLIAIAGWTVAAFGMGLGMASTSVLTLRLSPPAEQGRNSSALQLSDVLGSTLGIGLAGAAFAAWHTPGDDARLFSLMWLSAAAVALVAAGVGLRARTP